MENGTQKKSESIEKEGITTDYILKAFEGIDQTHKAVASFIARSVYDKKWKAKYNSK